MASGITVQSTPDNYTPAFNSQWHVATSSNIAQPNFKFRVVFTDLISGYTQTRDITPNPSNECEFDAARFSQLRINNYIPINSFGWKKCAGAVREIRVNIGEVWDVAGTPTYTAGSNSDYIVWNSAIELLDFSNYTLSSYVYDGSIPNYVYLTNLDTENTFDDRSNYFYILLQKGTTSDIPSIKVKAYNASGTLLLTSTIARPDFSTGIYTDQYVCIDLGKKAMDNASYLPAGTSYYVIHDTARNLDIKRYNISCEPRFIVYTLHFLCDNGKYETLHCSKLSTLTTTKTVTSFKKSPWTRSGYNKVLDYSAMVETPQSVTSQNGLILNSDWLTANQLLLYRQLFTSPDVKLDLGVSQGYASVKITDGAYQPRNEDRRRQLVFNLLFTHTNAKQRG